MPVLRGILQCKLTRTRIMRGVVGVAMLVFAVYNTCFRRFRRKKEVVVIAGKGSESAVQQARVYLLDH